MMRKQFVISPAAGKRLIGRAMTEHPVIRKVLEEGTLVVIAGTTNGYVAEEILKSRGLSDGFSRRRFFRGLTLPLSRPNSEPGKLPAETEFPGDVVLVRGQWQPGRTIFDVVDDLKTGDVVLKGANALDLERKRAAILIGHPKAGTIGASLQAVVGRRVELILPVGLEKRIVGSLDDLALKLNHPETHGPRLLPVPGQVFTEIDAVALLTGAQAELVAAGGVRGAEGSVWLAVGGEPEQVRAAEELLKSVRKEPLFEL